MESTDVRKQALRDWIAATCGKEPNVISSMVGDASFRRYFRVTFVKDETFVAMDAPPELEATESFVIIADLLKRCGVHAPDIVAADLAQGFLLLSDFGNTTFLRALTTENADQLYANALDTLAIIQSCRPDNDFRLPIFSRELMQNEWLWHQEWFLDKFLGMGSLPRAPVIDACYNMLVESALEQPQVFMHRDYHSANLMCLPHDEVGVLDFQDAFMGPVTYDLASLLRDCYISWSDKRVLGWAASYLDRLQQQGIFDRVSEAQFLQWFDYMGVQRHIKALFTFARKAIRDQQPDYLAHVPRTLRYIIDVTQNYQALTPLHQLYKYEVLERLDKLHENQEIICEQ